VINKINGIRTNRLKTAEEIKKHSV
jgi:hypothetical protein